MAIQLNSVGQVEHERIPFIDAIAEVDTFNGAFGEVVDGKFKLGAAKKMVIMQKECGDDEGMPKYPIAKGSHVRVLPLEKCKGNLLNIYDYPLPETVAKEDKLESQADGSLKVNKTATGVHLVVKEIIGNHDGVVALITE